MRYWEGPEANFSRRAVWKHPVKCNSLVPLKFCSSFGQLEACIDTSWWVQLSCFIGCNCGLWPKSDRNKKFPNMNIFLPIEYTYKRRKLKSGVMSAVVWFSFCLGLCSSRPCVLLILIPPPHLWIWWSMLKPSLFLKARLGSCNFLDTGSAMTRTMFANGVEFCFVFFLGSNPEPE